MPAHASKVRRRLLAACLTLIASCTLTAIPAWAEEPPFVTISNQQDSFYCEERKLGYWFYCTRPKPPEQDTAVPAPSSSATSQLDAVTATLREL